MKNKILLKKVSYLPTHLRHDIPYRPSSEFTRLHPYHTYVDEGVREEVVDISQVDGISMEYIRLPPKCLGMYLREEISRPCVVEFFLEGLEEGEGSFVVVEDMFRMPDAMSRLAYAQIEVFIL